MSLARQWAIEATQITQLPLAIDSVCLDSGDYTRVTFTSGNCNGYLFMQDSTLKGRVSLIATQKDLFNQVELNEAASRGSASFTFGDGNEVVESLAWSAFVQYSDEEARAQHLMVNSVESVVSTAYRFLRLQAQLDKSAPEYGYPMGSRLPGFLRVKAYEYGYPVGSIKSKDKLSEIEQAVCKVENVEREECEELSSSWLGRKRLAVKDFAVRKGLIREKTIAQKIALMV